MRRVLAAGLLLLAGVSAPASAALMTYTVDLYVTNFENGNPDGGVHAVVTFDDSATTSTLPVDSISFSDGLSYLSNSTPQDFKFFSTSGGVLSLGGNLVGLTDDYLIQIRDFYTIPRFDNMLIQHAGSPAVDRSTTASFFSITSVPATAVPEPALVGLFGLSVLGLAAHRRENKSKLGRRSKRQFEDAA